MNDQTQQTNDNLERATRQLDTIEQLITLLMDDIDFSELKMSERLNIAIKLMAQHARTLKLRDDINEEQDPSKEQAFFANLRRQLRGGPSDQDFDDPFSSEEDIHPFFPQKEF